MRRKYEMKTRYLLVVCCLFSVVFLSSVAEAKKSYLSSVNSTCSASYDCGLCHVDPKGGGPLTADGEGFASSGYDPAYFCGATTCTDGDGDGFAIEGGDCGAIDCDDSNGLINPGVAEVCDDTTDNDCDDNADCDDGECNNAPVCAVASEPEICDDKIDNDGDGKVDCADKKDCRTDPFCGGGGDQEICDDGIDNDNDGKIDCADRKDCRKNPYCA
jgi:hypothetical protein